MAGAPYRADVALSDDATFELPPVEIAVADGTAFPFGDYAFEYSVAGLPLFTQADGIAVQADQNAIVISRPTARLPVGRYPHGLRYREIATGRVSQLFDGTLTITEGNFR